MSDEHVYLAVDLGAESGRVIAGVTDGRRFVLDPVNRFETRSVDGPDGLHWDISFIYDQILDGLKAAAARWGKKIESIGVDTWGVDYALLDPKGDLLGDPFHYRDARTDGMMDQVFRNVPKTDIYKGTGIQCMPFNTLFQLASEGERLNEADCLLFMPDLLNYWLTGVRANERTIASTSQLLDARTGDWNRPLIERLGFPGYLFRKIVAPGQLLGDIRQPTRDRTGLQRVKVVAVGSHDTASAVAAVPAIECADCAYLSSGTWSLMGIEEPGPVISDEAMGLGFTNEAGVANTIRLLKNISGLWLIQQSRSTWKQAGNAYNYAELTSMADGATPFAGHFNPDDPRLAKPGDMPARINQLLKETGQPPIDGEAQMSRLIFENLAFRYRHTMDQIENLTGKRRDVLHIIGGGSKNRLLSQFTANVLNRPVITGPGEATAIGNILVQMLATGQIDSIADGRALVRGWFELDQFDPIEPDTWDAQYRQFIKLAS